MGKTVCMTCAWEKHEGTRKRVFLEIEEGANFCRIHVQAEEAADLRSEHAAFLALEERLEAQAERAWDSAW